MEFRELQDTAGRMFRAGMGAEAIRDLLRNISLDELSAQLRLETHSTADRSARRPPSGCASWSHSVRAATALSG